MESDNDIDDSRISVDTDGPSGEWAKPTTRPGGGDWNLIHRLDALSAIYKNLAEGYGARPGHAESAQTAIEHLEAVIAGLVRQLPIPPVETPAPTLDNVADEEDPDVE